MNACGAGERPVQLFRTVTRFLSARRCRAKQRGCRVPGLPPLPPGLPGLLPCLLLLALACAPAGEPPTAGTTLQLDQLLGGADTLHARAVEPRPFDFPADHGPHPDFRTEWWYFTGNLNTDDGRELGYQLTFFRSALVDSATFMRRAVHAGSAMFMGDTVHADSAMFMGDTVHADSVTSTAAATGTGPPNILGAAVRADATSAWRTRHAWMAHFAVSDASTSRFEAAERFARGAVGLAGAQVEPFRVWLGDWSAVRHAPGPVTMNDDASAMFPLRLRADHDNVAIDLNLKTAKPLVLHGERGLSRKGAQPGNASYYYSFTRMPTHGTVTIDGTTHHVSGTSWLDREWSTSALAEGVTGWDWTALQLSDSTELMLYRLRRGDGTADSYSAGTFIAADGTSTPLTSAAFTMTPVRTWGDAAYPTSWRIEVPDLAISLTADASFDAQELVLAIRYWEGMVRATGTRRGLPVTARGYLEMTGYAAGSTPARRPAR